MFSELWDCRDFISFEHVGQFHEKQKKHVMILKGRHWNDTSEFLSLWCQTTIFCIVDQSSYYTLWCETTLALMTSIGWYKSNK